MPGSRRVSGTWRVCRSAPCGCIEATRIDFRRRDSYPRASDHHSVEDSVMKRALTVLALAAAVGTPAAAQWAGMPVWNSPKGGTGITISGDFGKPNADYGKGSAFGGRGSVGLGALTLTVGMDSWKPS